MSPDPLTSHTSWLEMVRRNVSVEDAARIKGVPLALATGHMRRALIEHSREQARKFKRDGFQRRTV